MLPRMDLERLEAWCTKLSLVVEEYFQPDDLFATDYRGPSLLATVFAGRLASLTADGTRVSDCPVPVTKMLLETAALARAEKIEPAPDTAVGRRLTSLSVRVDAARGVETSFAFHATLNHLCPTFLPPAWSSLLRTLRDQLGPGSGALADAWDLALVWAAPFALGPHFDAGMAVRLPHVVTTLEHAGPLYVRTGQPPGPSTLYRVTAHGIEAIGSAHRAASSEPPARPAETHRPSHSEAPLRWPLPCGGGTVLAVRESFGADRFGANRSGPPVLQYVLRTDDARGLYVQKAEGPA